jgi:hypothetical protein
MVVHTFNSRIQTLRQEDCEVEANLGYIVRPCLKKAKKQKIKIPKIAIPGEGGRI